MAVVVEKQFRGAEFLYKLLYNDQYPLLCFAPSHHNHKIGESIGIQLEMEHYVIFEK
jgi:iron(III) transport system ATP-binding protein